MRSRPFLLFTLPHQWGCWGGTRSWESTQPGQLTPADPGDIPDRMAPCSAYKERGEDEGRGGHPKWWHLSSQVINTHEVALFSWGWLNTSLQPLGVVNKFHVLLCLHAFVCLQAFVLLIKLPVPQPMSFHPFSSLCHPTRGKQVSSSVGLNWCPRLNHNKHQIVKQIIYFCNRFSVTKKELYFCLSSFLQKCVLSGMYH